MTVEMVLNELSHQVLASDIYSARRLLSGLRETMQSATQLGVKRILRTGKPVYEIELAPDYFVSSWLSDTRVDQVERGFLRSIATKAPYLQDISTSEIANAAELSEFYYQNEKADGFRYAYWIEAIAVSFLSNDRWDRSVIDNISVQSLDTDTGQLQQRQAVSVNHASRTDHLARHENWIAECIRDSIRDGQDIWYRKEELYPNLLLCDALRRQLRAIHSSHLALRQVKKRLSELEIFCRNWTQGSFTSKQLHGNPRTESQATLQQYPNERTFMCPDGVERIFSWHARINPGAWRLHFFPLENEQKIIIGYIGPHLSTATDN